MVFEDCEDLKSFFSIRTDPVHYNHWSLKGLGCDTDLQSMPVIYTGKRKYLLSSYCPLEMFIITEGYTSVFSGPLLKSDQKTL